VGFELSEQFLGMDDLMNAGHAYVLAGMSLEATAGEHPALMRELREFDPLKLATAFAALLTVPDFQSNCLRLEALIQLGFAVGSGRRKPLAKHLMRWFADLGKGRCGAFEDPAEDVFVSLIATPRGNFRVLEGIWESGTFYLQRVMEVVEGMPADGPLGALRESVYGLLALSEAICERASLPRHLLGNPIPNQSLPVGFANVVDGLRRRIRFSPADLDHLAAAAGRLGEFVFDPRHRGRILEGSVGHSLLERYPLVWNGGTYHFLLPTATSAAIRRFVLERVNDLGVGTSFSDALANEYADLMRDTPLLGRSSSAPVRFQKVSRHPVASTTTSVDEGRYLNFVFFMDTLDGFSETGLAHPNPDAEELGDAIGKMIDTSQTSASQEPGFRDGITIVVSCGIGRTTAISGGTTAQPNWRIEFLSAADLTALSWLPEMSPLFLWKLHEAQAQLAALGVELQNANGLLNLIAWVRHHHGHLVPHEAMPVEFAEDDRPKFILIEQNGLRLLRHEAATSWDAQAVQNIAGEWIRVRKPEQSHYQEDRAKPLYASEDRGRSRWPLGVYLTGARPWWWELEVADGSDGYMIFQRWQMAATWLSRAAPVLDGALYNLPSGPLLLRLKFEGVVGDIDGDIAPIGYDEAVKQIAVSLDPGGRTVVAVASQKFEPANFNATNVAEGALVARIIDGFAQLAGETPTGERQAALLAAIVPDSRARQTHMFRARSFLDRVRGALPGTPVLIDPIDGATPKLGLGWRIRERKLGADTAGKENCVKLLNAAVATLEDDLCRDLRQFDRETLIVSALRNHESAAIDLQRWMMTSSAVLALHEDKQAAADVIALHEYQVNAVSLTTRLLVEFGLCECPLRGGVKPGRLDLTRLMAKAASLPGYGGWSDAVRWDAMEPILKIRPLGDIHAKSADFEEIVANFGRAGSDLRVADAGENYARNLEEIGVRESSEAELDAAFLAAWMEEFGTSFDDMRRFIEAFEDMGAHANQPVLRLSKSELASVKWDGKALPPEPTSSIIEALLLKPRSRWRETPTGYDDKDRQPWRFRRRLSVLRKPLIQIDDGADPIILVAPGLLRAGFVYMAGGFLRGDFPAWQLKPLMQSWAGAESDRRGKQFNAEVAARLRDLGWQAESEVAVTRLLAKGFDRNYGDVDVVAWRPESGRVAIIECKDVQLRKTYGEIAEQLADFRGEIGANGRPDYLLRHLNRVDLISQHLARVTKYLKLPLEPKLESYLLFKHPVPMRFALKRMEERVRVRLFSELREL
jgi:hypothetical protein